ncbi:MAG: RlmE family RNA methyltransferase [Planctomycetota bacterium]
MARRILHDQYFKKAKREGYLARSAYKLIEIDERRELFHDGDRVLDLGCAPGSWIQVACERIGDEGRVVGIDLLPVASAFGENVTIFRGDMHEADAGQLKAAAGGAFDVVISDMAPNTSGHGDAERSAQLCRDVLGLLPGLLRRGGKCAMKVLEGNGYQDLLDETKGQFRFVKGLKPRATREVSTEMYIIAEGYRPTEHREDLSDLPPHLRPGGDRPRGKRDELEDWA